MMLETVVGLLGTATMGTIGWAFHVTSRVAVLESEKDSLKTYIETILNLRFQEVNRRLARIETKLDAGEE